MTSLSSPVFVKPIVQDDKQALKIWTGSGIDPIIVPSPLLPYLYSREKVEAANGKRTMEVLTPLSSRTKEQFYKYTFNTWKDYKAFVDSGTVKATEVSQDYINLINLNNPDFFKQYPSKNVKTLTFDIEQLTDGTKFPEKDAPLLSIAYQINEEKIICICSDGHNDYDIVAHFAEILVKEDPDVIIGWNHCKYDIPVLDFKFTIYGIPNSVWGREERGPFHYIKSIGPNELHCVSIPGRVVFDVYHSALIDQTLNGESRRLKHVAKLFKKDIAPDAEVVEEDMNDNRHLIGTDDLIKYNSSDVFWTKKLFDMYWKNNEALAAFTGAPLNKLVPLATTYGFTQVLGTIFKDIGYLADTTNRERYPYAFEGLKEYINEFGQKKKEKPFIGAIVRCFREKELFFNVVDCDVNSLYPSIIAALSIGPDNTRIVRTEKYGPFRVEKVGNVRTYYAPDEMRKWTWVIEVTGESKIASRIETFLKQRMEVKRLSKVKNDDALFSLAYSLKIVLNSVYGLCGSEVIPYGELGCAALTTIVGRMIISEGHKFLGEEFTLLIDTDAVKLEEKNFKGVKEVSAHINEWFPRVTLGKPSITWDVDKYEAIWILQMKNYLTLKKNKKGELEFKKHGGSFKGTKLTNIFNKVIDRVGYILLTEGAAAARKAALKAYNLKSYEPGDFVMVTKIGKKLDEYSGDNVLQKQVGLMAQQKKGQDVYVGQNISFVKTSYGYDLPSDEAFKKIDTAYYTEIITTALSRLGLEKVRESRLEQWL